MILKVYSFFLYFIFLFDRSFEQIENSAAQWYYYLYIRMRYKWIVAKVYRNR